MHKKRKAHLLVGEVKHVVVHSRKPVGEMQLSAADYEAFGPAVERAVNNSKARKSRLAAFGARQRDLCETH
ncbi:hypothetical protein HBO14_12285 [Pseudomonas sp. WS 5406]|uniref:hypothetical protein n=1 Tax=Pseudomonas sp. WS 5406 TaxID=2717498 RepID=UPI00147330FB|nr:hypothetical protein [Pseudomonas sp. WS 5406]NMX27305.1 hypothetical protein [Pseudomonas sp. WS 5406]